MLADKLSRRDLLRVGCGLLGLSLPQLLGLRSQASARAPAPDGFGRARSCIVLFCWGGMSHLDTWDPKPDAPPEVRGEFKPIATATPGIHLGECMPLLARQTGRLAVVRSMHHRAGEHGQAMYWNFTGHAPPGARAGEDQPASRQDWPCLGSMVARFRPPPSGLPGSVQVPYPMIDDGRVQGGQNGGWLGMAHDPVLVRPDRGKPYGGVSRDLGAPVLKLADDVDRPRLEGRQALAQTLNRYGPSPPTTVGAFEHLHRSALDLLLSSRVQAAFDLDREPLPRREAYGDHVCGQSVLLARRLTEVGVPLVTVICAAGDLNNAVGDHWDTHNDNFKRLRNVLLPPFDRASAALLDDLSDRGRLDETLVVLLTEFGRTPRVRGAGRDHFPDCYSVALAGGGVRGGQVYGRSDALGRVPAVFPCEPADLHATIFHALGIPRDVHLNDNLGRSFALSDGRPLPLF